MIIFALQNYRAFMRYINFNNFPFGLLRTLASYLRYEHYDKGTYIYTSGQKATKFYGVIKGSVSARVTAPFAIKRLIKNNKHFNNYYDLYSQFRNFDLDQSFEYEEGTIEENNNKFNSSFSLKNFVSKDSSKGNTLIRNDDNNQLQFNKHTNNKPNLHIDIINTCPNVKAYETKYNLEHEVSKFSPGMCFGDLELVKGTNRTTAMYCLEDTDLFILDKEYFDLLLKRIIYKADEERKNFIRHKVPLVSFETLNLTRPEFYDKGSIIYTEFQKASDIFIIYQGECALKKLDNPANESEIFEHKDKLKTISILDRGGIAGLESTKPPEMGCNYEHTLVVIRDFTVLYRMNIHKLELSESRMKRYERIQKDKKDDKGKDNSKEGIRSFFYNIYLLQKEIANKKALNEMNTYQNSVLGCFKKLNHKKLNIECDITNNSNIPHNQEYGQIIPTIMEEKTRNKASTGSLVNLKKCHSEFNNSFHHKHQIMNVLKSYDDIPRTSRDPQSPKSNIAFNNNNITFNSEHFRMNTSFHPRINHLSPLPYKRSRNLKLQSFLFRNNSSSSKHLYTTSNIKSTQDITNNINSNQIRIIDYKYKPKSTSITKYFIQSKFPFIKDINLQRVIHEIKIKKRTNIVNTGHFKMPLLSSKKIKINKH